MTTCEQCEGGWIITTENGNTATRECECRRVLKLERMLERAGLPARYLDATFDTYDWRGTPPSIQRAYLDSKTYAENFLTDREQGLLLYGSVGTGKTHLAVSIIRHVTLALSVRTNFVDFRQLLKRLQGTFTTSTQSTEEVMRPVLDAELLVLDEIGAARATDWTFEIVEEVLNHRYNQALATVITTNLPNLPCSSETPAEGQGGYARAAAQAMRLETLGDRIGARMYSRVQQMCRPIELQGPDHRRSR